MERDGTSLAASAIDAPCGAAGTAEAVIEDVRHRLGEPPSAWRRRHRTAAPLASLTTP
ncbi:hypothetical protein [Inquilinus limosus]|uniref:hypothetical protein n=1 Tax=Inquilinus limosus TaxID=171674 RepID=UPI0015C5A384|nr:hypothetical protein [Inquilinus limosus]